MQKFTMVVSETTGEKGNKKRIEIGKVEATVPLLDEVASVIVTAKVAELDKESGLPVYDTDEANFVFNAVLAAVKAMVRNRLVPKSIKLKDGAIIPSNWAELCAEASPSGAALANFRDCKNAFTAYVATLGKSEATANRIVLFFSNKEALATQTMDTKSKFLVYVEQFAETLKEDDAERFLSTLEKVMATATSETVEAGDDM
jgi:hypothetical protein